MSIYSAMKMKKNQLSLFDIFAPRPFQDVYHLVSQKEKKNNSFSQSSTCNKAKKNSNKFEYSCIKETPYVTCEKYHELNRHSSNKSLIRSTSTLFYDLDKLVKRHSYHCVSELTNLKKTVVRTEKDKCKQSKFGAKSETIVQECETQIQPILRMQDSFEINSKKIKRKHLPQAQLSSDLFLNDKEDTNYNANIFVKQEDNRQQKFWSYAKYETEYSKPMQKEKKYNKKDRGKRTEDPCPCQLFSYACPCTDKKSLTELAKNSKSLTVIDQLTSTTIFPVDAGKDYKINKSKISKCVQNYDSKPMSTNVTGAKDKYEISPVSTDISPPLNSRVASKLVDDSSYTKKSVKVKSKSRKISKQIVCPNCKEKLDIYSTTDEDDCIKTTNSPIFRNSFLASQQEDINSKNNYDINTDNCNHNPPCEMVPVCQILPTETNYGNSKYVDNVSTGKNNPKMIRITKACRHHPPCTVVPSCQRINVLNNNCEYIPPCIHRPRCVNLPLCVPFSKNFYYDDVLNKTEEVDNIDCSRQYRYISAHKHDSLNSTVNHQFHPTQNTCEYFSEYSPRYISNSKMTHIAPAFSPFLPTPLPCKCCKSNKSCQYDCFDCKCLPRTELKESASVDAIVYIRDVGCQFRNKSFSPQDSVLYSKGSSTLFNLHTTKTGNYYTQFHTLRYEDKCTNPISGEDLSMSTFTTSSLEIDDHCPSHGRQYNRGYTEFSPKSTASPIVAAFTTDPLLSCGLSISRQNSGNRSKQDKVNIHSSLNCSSKSRRSFLKGKHKHVFPMRRRRKSRHQYGWHVTSKRIMFN